MSSFWSWWIIVLTVATFVGTFWVLFANRTRAPADPEQTTGHAADGIEEYDNPLPYWWFLMFMITLVFGIGYLVVYVSVPFGTATSPCPWKKLRRTPAR